MPPSNPVQPQVAAQGQGGYTLNELLDQAVNKMRPLRRHVFSLRLRNKAFREQTLAELQLKLSEDSKAVSLMGAASLADDKFDVMSSKIQLDPDKLKQFLDLIIEYLPAILDLIFKLFGVIAFIALTLSPSLVQAQCRPGQPCWNQRQVNYMGSSSYVPYTTVRYVQPQYTAPVRYEQPQVRYEPAPVLATPYRAPAPTQQINFVGCDNCGADTVPCPCDAPGCNCGAQSVQVPSGSTVEYPKGTVLRATTPNGQTFVVTERSYNSSGSAVQSFGSTGSAVQSYGSSGSQAVQSYGSTGSAAYGSYGTSAGSYGLQVNNYVTRRRTVPVSANIYNSATYHSNGSGQSLADHLSRTHGINGYVLSPAQQEAAHAAAHAGTGVAYNRRGPVRRLFGY